MHIKWLRSAGLVAGIAGLIEITVWGFFHYEGGPSWVAVPPLSVYVVPFLASIIIAWRKPLAGGLLLIGIVIFWLVSDITINFSHSHAEPVLSLLQNIVKLMLPIFIPQLVTGLLFLISREKAQKNS